jgi:hypothetical protein
VDADVILVLNGGRQVFLYTYILNKKIGLWRGVRIESCWNLVGRRRWKKRRKGWGLIIRFGWNRRGKIRKLRDD